MGPGQRTTRPGASADAYEGARAVQSAPRGPDAVAPPAVEAQPHRGEAVAVRAHPLAAHPDANPAHGNAAAVAHDPGPDAESGEPSDPGPARAHAQVEGAARGQPAAEGEGSPQPAAIRRVDGHVAGAARRERRS